MIDVAANRSENGKRRWRRRFWTKPRRARVIHHASTGRRRPDDGRHAYRKHAAGVHYQVKITWRLFSLGKQAPARRKLCDLARWKAGAKAARRRKSADGLVKVDGTVETRKRCKIVAGQTAVSFEGRA